jgi:hypothetical protein
MFTFLHEIYDYPSWLFLESAELQVERDLVVEADGPLGGALQTS